MKGILLKFGIGWFMLLATMACKDELRIVNFEAEKWKADVNGCHGERQRLLTTLMASQSSLIGRNEVEIKRFLGKPDANDLRSRGQKFFEYGIRGGNFCDPASQVHPEILRIRFDALDRVVEVSVY